MAPIPSFGRKILDFFSLPSPKPQGKSSFSGSSLSRPSEESFEMMTFKPYGSELAPAPPFRAPAPAPAPFRPLRSSLVADSPPQLPNFDFGPAFEVPSKWTSAKRDLVFPETKSLSLKQALLKFCLEALVLSSPTPSNFGLEAGLQCQNILS